jgi:hypothetical protein
MQKEARKEKRELFWENMYLLSAYAAFAYNIALYPALTNVVINFVQGKSPVTGFPFSPPFLPPFFAVKEITPLWFLAGASLTLASPGWYGYLLVKGFSPTVLSLLSMYKSGVIGILGISGFLLLNQQVVKNLFPVSEGERSNELQNEGDGMDLEVKDSEVEDPEVEDPEGEPQRAGVDAELEPQGDGVDAELEPQRDGVDAELEPQGEGVDPNQKNEEFWGQQKIKNFFDQLFENLKKFP